MFFQNNREQVNKEYNEYIKAVRIPRTTHTIPRYQQTQRSWFPQIIPQAIKIKQIGKIKYTARVKLDMHDR